MFYIIEVHESMNGNGEIVQPIEQTLERNVAIKKYHELCAEAIDSEIPKHTIGIMDGTGNFVMKETFSHV